MSADIIFYMLSGMVTSGAFGVVATTLYDKRNEKRGRQESSEFREYVQENMELARYHNDLQKMQQLEIQQGMLQAKIKQIEDTDIQQIVQKQMAEENEMARWKQERRNEVKDYVARMEMTAEDLNRRLNEAIKRRIEQQEERISQQMHFFNHSTDRKREETIHFVQMIGHDKTMEFFQRFNLLEEMAAGTVFVHRMTRERQTFIKIVNSPNFDYGGFRTNVLLKDLSTGHIVDVTLDYFMNSYMKSSSNSFQCESAMMEDDAVWGISNGIKLCYKQHRQGFYLHEFWFLETGELFQQRIREADTGKIIKEIKLGES